MAQAHIDSPELDLVSLFMRHRSEDKNAKRAPSDQLKPVATNLLLGELFLQLVDPAVRVRDQRVQLLLRHLPSCKQNRIILQLNRLLFWFSLSLVRSGEEERCKVRQTSSLWAVNQHFHFSHNYGSFQPTNTSFDGHFRHDALQLASELLPPLLHQVSVFSHQLRFRSRLVFL